MARDKRVKEIKNVPEQVLYGGKIPPHSKELEMNILGGMMIDNELIDNVAAILKPKNFYVNANGLIYRAMLDLHEKKIPVDVLTLAEELKNRGELDAIGGPFYLAELSGTFSNAETIEFSAHKVYENWQKRDMILLTYSLNEQCYDPVISADELLSKADKEISFIQGQRSRSDKRIKTFNFSRTMEEVTTHVDEGLPTQYQKLNARINGFNPGDLILIAGRPSHGKTALALNFIKHYAEKGYNQGLFTLEMMEKKQAVRIIANVTSVDSKWLLYNKLDTNELNRVAQQAHKFKDWGEIAIDDISTALPEIMAAAKHMVKNLGCRIIYLDHIGLVDLQMEANDIRAVKLGDMSSKQKRFARDHGVTWVDLVQFSRKSEDRIGKDKRPKISDMRDSGRLEEDADVILIPYRPDFENNPEEAYVNIGKARDGDVGDWLPFHFEKRFLRFTELSHAMPPPEKKSKEKTQGGGLFKRALEQSQEGEPF